MYLPRIIQGGMGAGVSNWVLARSVAETGQLGVVSGTALDTILARRLQTGDEGGHIRRALEHFPVPDIAHKVMKRYFVPGGKPSATPFKSVPAFRVDPSPFHVDLTVLANFVEVFLAKEGHKGHVGINYLEKIQFPHLPSIFGAMLAGVDNVLMGAGIPRAIPGIMDSFAEWKRAELKINVHGAKSDESFMSRFDPSEWIKSHMPHFELKTLKRPDFFAIISSNALALNLAKKASGKVNGFIVEAPTAGGHNAPPRGSMQLNDKGEPIYGDKDAPDLEQLKKLGIPFWLAGSRGTPEGLSQALESGAEGIQVGTAFAFCDESGFLPEIKDEVKALAREGKAKVFTDPRCSPTGFPFKVLQLKGTLSEEKTYEERKRICDVCYLRHAYRKDDGSLGYRCPSEPVQDYLKKGGVEDETVGRKCVCNGLLASIGLQQSSKSGNEELPLVTCGDDVGVISYYLQDGADGYSAKDVVAHLMTGSKGTESFFEQQPMLHASGDR